jgi:hypothetical protein
MGSGQLSSLVSRLRRVVPSNGYPAFTRGYALCCHRSSTLRPAPDIGEGAVLFVQPQMGLALLFVGAVALEAYFRERSRCCCRWGTYGMRNRLRTTQPLSAEG